MYIALNGSKLPTGEVIEVSIAAVGRRVLSLDGEPTNLYIENMPNHWNNDQLMRIFGRFGNIIQSKISGNNVAFVRFETHKQALDAIDNMHGTIFDTNSNQNQNQNTNTSTEQKDNHKYSKPLSVRFATCQHKKAKDAMMKSRHTQFKNHHHDSSCSSLSLS